MPLPPYSSHAVMPSRPRSPIFLPQVHRELVAAIDLACAGRDLGLRERVHGVAQCVDVFAEHEVQAGEGAHHRLLGAGRRGGAALVERDFS